MTMFYLDCSPISQDVFVKLLLSRSGDSKVNLNTPAIVLGGGITGLSVTRSLGNASIPVHLLGVEKNDIACFSRYASAAELPSYDDPDAVVEQIRNTCDSMPTKPVLFITSDTHLDIVSSNRDELSELCTINIPSRTSVDTVLDKALFSDFCAYDLKMPTVGHVGDGNLHPVICYDGTNKDEVERVEAASAELFRKVVALGGTITGEHGIGLAKIPYMAWEHEKESLAVMRSMKETLDPKNILNPGKMGL